MASEAELLALASACEKANGPDRELDCGIAVGLHGGHIRWRQAVGTMESYPVRDYTSSAHVQGYGCDHISAYTASLDAAMSLVPEGLRFYVDNGTVDSTSHACAFAGRDGGVTGGCKIAATPALALCAAALRARAATMGGSDD